jgi:pre-mRNA-splicing factor 38A
MELKYIGGVYGGNIKPSPFLCLILKMLQIQPEKDIIVEFISQPDFKYVRALGALYMRLVGSSLDCYKYLEPLYLDYRKLKKLNRMGEYELIYMDDFIDELLHDERIFDIILPRIQKRHILEDSNQLDARVSALEENLDEMDEDGEEGEFRDNANVAPAAMTAAPITDTKTSHIGSGSRDWDKPRRSPSPRFRRSRSPHRRRADSKDRERDARKDTRDRDRDRAGDRDRDRDRDKHRRRSHSPRDRERRHKRDEGGSGHHHHKSRKTGRHDATDNTT